MKLFVFDDLLKHTAILFSAMMVVHVCNLAYQMVMSRVLPEGEFALLAALLSVLTILARPLGTLTTGMSHYSSLLIQRGRLGDVGRMVRKWGLLAGIPGLLLSGVILLASSQIAEFFHLDRVEPVFVAGLIVAGLFVFPILTGAGQGIQRFGWVSVATIAGAASRLLIGAGMVLMVYPACGWALVGHGSGLYISISVLLLGLFICLHGSAKTDLPLPSMRRYLVQSLFIQIAYAVLMNADMIFVRHYLPFESGFAYAATLSRLVAFLPVAIAAAMFPKVSSDCGSTDSHKQIFFRSFIYTTLFVFAAVFGCCLFPGFLLRMLFGVMSPSMDAVFLVRLMSVTMGISALLNVGVQFLLAQRLFCGGLWIILFSVVYAAAVTQWHAAPSQIVWVAAGTNFLALIAALIVIARSFHTMGDAAA